MRCGRVRNLLMDYIAGELSEKTVHELSEHLCVCQSCTTELEMARRASDMLVLLSHEEETKTDVLMPTRKAQFASPRRYMRLALLFGMLAAIVICIAGSNVLRLSRQVKEISSKSQSACKDTTDITPLRNTSRGLPNELKGRVARRKKVAKRLRHHHKLRHSDRTFVANAEVTAKGEDQRPLEVELRTSSLPTTIPLPEGAVMMVSVKESAPGENDDESYSYRYRECGSEQREFVEYRGSRNDRSVEIRIYDKASEN